MSARDLYPDCVREALIGAGWQITHDPYKIPIGFDKVFVDLGAERPLAAEKDGRKIAVEIKSFLGPSDVYDLERALGQYVLYRALMDVVEPDRLLYLAVPTVIHQQVFRRPIAEIPVESLRVAFIVFDPDRREIVRWIP